MRKPAADLREEERRKAQARRAALGNMQKQPLQPVRPPVDRLTPPQQPAQPVRPPVYVPRPMPVQPPTQRVGGLPKLPNPPQAPGRRSPVLGNKKKPKRPGEYRLY